MKDRARALLVAVAALCFASSFFSESSAQKRKSGFTHASAAHKKLQCASCHKMPTGNWLTARGYPDVADFPGHAACFACHKSDFFAGNKPAICANCHVSPGPRGVARFAFPVRTRMQEFSTIFPHNVHQDIIAKMNRQIGTAVAHFVPAAFVKPADDKPQFNNCAICHQPYSELPKFTARILTGVQPLAEPAANTFVPKAGFFKEMPQGHASCFACHYQGVKPAATECAGCHRLSEAYTPSDVVPRYSLKFDHQQKEHATRDCMTCHVRISQNADVKKMKDADVPILTCSTSACHGKHILEEIGKRETSVAAKQPPFQCTYCHVPEMGRYPVPQSHQKQ